MKAFCECGHELRAEIDGRTYFLCWKCTPKFAVEDRVRFCTYSDHGEWVVVHVNEEREHYVLRRPGAGMDPSPEKGARVAFAGELVDWAKSAPWKGWESRVAARVALHGTPPLLARILANPADAKHYVPGHSAVLEGEQGEEQ